MKSIFWAYGMIVGSFVLFLSFSWYIQFDHTQSVIELATKRALKSTMADYVDESEFEADEVIDTFTSYFHELAIEDFKYEITLEGFMKEPLFMKVHVEARNEQPLKRMKIQTNEAMIEELSE